MKKLFVILVLAALAALLVAGGISSALNAISGPSWADMERQRLAVEQAEAVAPAQTFAAQALTLFPVAVAYTALALAAVGGAVALTRFRRYARPDGAGRLPVELVDQHTAAAALAAFHQVQLAAAQRQLVPANYAPHVTQHYAPRLDYRRDAGGDALPAPDEPAALVGAVPSFGELLSRGRIGAGQPLLLGFEAETGLELPGAWLDLYATATAGLPGSGKTTSQRFFACQTALHGARFVVCDPHMGAADDSLAATLAPLSSVYLCEPAAEPKAILEAVRYVADIGEARVRGRDDSRVPIILWVDELTGLLGRSDVGDELAGLLEQIAQEYRKRWVYLSASGQIWTAARTSSELRDSLASVLCHRMKRGQARLLLPTEEAAEAERLATGEAILWRTSGVTTRVRIPNTTAADVRQVAELIVGGAPSGATPAAPSVERPIGFRPGVRGGAAGGASGGAAHEPHRTQQDAEKLTSEEARIVAAFLGGKSLSDLAAELNGGRKSGDGFNQAARRITEILRKAMGGTQG